MRKAERRQKILAHARDVFARRGYHDAKIEDIVLAAGIARGTFYLYFKDKRAVFEEIVDRAFTQIGMAIVRVDPKDPARTVAEQVHENTRRIVGTLLEDRATTKILLTDAVGVDPAFDRKLQSFYEVVEGLLVREPERGAGARRRRARRRAHVRVPHLGRDEGDPLSGRAPRGGVLREAGRRGDLRLSRQGCLRVERPPRAMPKSA